MAWLGLKEEEEVGILLKGSSRADSGRVRLKLTASFRS